MFGYKYILNCPKINDSVISGIYSFANGYRYSHAFFMMVNIVKNGFKHSC